VTVMGMKRVALLLVVGLLAGSCAVQSGADAVGPVAGVSKKCKKKHGGKKKHKKCKKKKMGGSQPPGTTAPNQTAAALVISPPSWNFGSFPIGLGFTPQQFTVTNSAADGSGPLSTSITGANPGNFPTGGDGCAGKALDGGASCSLFVACVGSGSAPATFTADLVVSANPGGTRKAALTCSQF
jgi:hypothetical protein